MHTDKERGKNSAKTQTFEQHTGCTWQSMLAICHSVHTCTPRHLFGCFKGTLTRNKTKSNRIVGSLTGALIKPYKIESTGHRNLGGFWAYRKPSKAALITGPLIDPDKEPV